MKNNLKKCLALLVAMVMVLAMTVTVFATDSNQGGSSTLTIEKGTGNTYSVYQIATFDVETLTENNDNTTVYTNIVVADAYKNGFKPDEVKNMSAEDRAALANTLAKIETTPIVINVTDGTVTGLKKGYYLIKETAHAANNQDLATKYILVAVDKETVTATLKTSTPNITKKIVLENSTTNVDGADQAGTLVDDNVVAIGDTVTYQIDATIPEYPEYATGVTYTITDTMSNGLTPCDVEDITIQIKGSTDTEYTSCEGVITTVSGQTITISIPSKKIIATPGGAVRVTLSGTLNNNASVGSTGNPNSVDLTYTNNWDQKTTHKTPEDTVITYTGKLNIEKVDSVDKTKKLSGAEFAVYGPKNYNATAPTDVDNTITIGEGANAITYYYHSTITSGKDGKASISGLDAGTYYAVETKAPSGYSVDATPQEIKLTVSSTQISGGLEKEGDVITPSGETGSEANTNATNTYTATWSNTEENPSQIENTKGTTLPGTGGIGTTIFTFGGLALVILAAALFIVYMKKQKKQA